MKGGATQHNDAGTSLIVHVMLLQRQFHLQIEQSMRSVLVCQDGWPSLHAHIEER